MSSDSSRGATSNELPPCTLGCLFNNQCSAERTQRFWNVALGYCDRAGRPRVNPGRPGRRRSDDICFEEDRDGRAGGPGGTRGNDHVPRACSACMERAVDLHPWMPVGGGRRRTEVDLYLLRCAECVSRDRAMPSFEEFAAELERAQRRGRAAERYTEACMNQIAANGHLAAAARECAASDVATFDLEQDLDGWRGYSALIPRKRLRSDEADEQRCVYDSSAAFDRAVDAYAVLEPHGVHAQSRRARAEPAEARGAEQRAARAAERAAARAAEVAAAEQECAAGGSSHGRATASRQEAEAAAGGYAVGPYTNILGRV
jgi:hypothetical protein